MAEARIVKTPGTCGGSARLDGHRLTVAHFVQLRRNGSTDDDILEGWDDLTQEQLDAVWAYYAEHREEIDDELRENYRISDLMEDAGDAQHPTAGELAAYFAGLPADMRIGFTLGIFDDAFRLTTVRKENGAFDVIGMIGWSEERVPVKHLSLERATTHGKRCPEITPANAREWLKETLEGLSESRTGSGWSPHIEFRLWNDISETDTSETDPARRKRAQPMLSAHERVRLKWLSDQCGGWFHYTETEGLSFIPADEWRPRYARWLESLA